MNFVKSKRPSLRTAGPEVVFSQEGGGFAVIADSGGIRLTGESGVIFDMLALQAFAKTVSDAWVEHTKLKPNLTQNLQGH